MTAFANMRRPGPKLDALPHFPSFAASERPLARKRVPKLGDKPSGFRNSCGSPVLHQLVKLQSELCGPMDSHRHCRYPPAAKFCNKSGISPMTSIFGLTLLSVSIVA